MKKKANKRQSLFEGIKVVVKCMKGPEIRHWGLQKLTQSVV